MKTKSKANPKKEINDYSYLQPLYDRGKIPNMKNSDEKLPEGERWYDIMISDHNNQKPEKQSLARFMAKQLSTVDGFNLEPISKGNSDIYTRIRTVMGALQRAKAEEYYNRLPPAAKKTLEDDYKEIKTTLKKINVEVGDNWKTFDFDDPQFLNTLLLQSTIGDKAYFLRKNLGGFFHQNKMYLDPHTKNREQSKTDTFIHEGGHAFDQYFTNENARPSREIIEKHGVDFDGFRKHVGKLLADKHLGRKDFRAAYPDDGAANNEVIGQILPNLNRNDWRFPPIINQKREEYLNSDENIYRKTLRQMLKNERAIFDEAGLSVLLDDQKQDFTNSHRYQNITRGTYTINNDDNPTLRDAKTISNMFFDRIEELRKPQDFREPVHKPEHIDQWQTENSLLKKRQTPFSYGPNNMQNEDIHESFFPNQRILLKGEPGYSDRDDSYDYDDIRMPEWFVPNTNRPAIGTDTTKKLKSK